jgi:tetratricopeptide (TPR) repeat protein
MGAIRTRLAAWRKRHPRLTVFGLITIGALIVWGGYEGKRSYDSRTHFKTAQQAAERRDWKDARDNLKEAMRIRPDDPDMHLLAARVERRLEHLDEAKRHLDTCERLSGSSTEAIKVERALLRVHAGELAEVEEYLRARIEQDVPNTVEILDILSAALELNYREAESQRFLDELLRRRPDDFDALVRRGRTGRNMGWYEDAIQYYAKALQIRPDVDNVRLAMAELQVGLGRFEQAREHFERLHERQPDNPAVEFGLAVCAAGTGDSEQAMQRFNDLLAANPKNWMARNERGKLAVQMDRLEDGLVDLRIADSLAPPDVAPTHLVNCLLLLGKNDEAKKYQDKVAGILADRKRATELGDQIRERTPNDPEPRYEMGRVLMRLGKQRDAVHWFRTAIQKDPGHRKSHEALVEFFQSVNAKDEADHHRRILERLPGTTAR